MKWILKILFAPVVAVLVFFTWLCTVAVNLSAAVMAFVAALCAIMGVITLCTDSITRGLVGLAVAFVLSPWGLPMAAAWLIAQLHILRLWMKEKIYE